MEPGKKPPHSRMFNLSKRELQVLQGYLNEQLRKEFIRQSASPAAAPLFFIKKPHTKDELRPVIDYRKLNKITAKDRGPLPSIQESIDRLKEATIFTKIDLRDAYNSIRFKEGGE